MAESAEQKVSLVLKGHLEGHNGWVTAIAPGNSIKENEDTHVLISGGRDKTIIIWKFNNDPKDPKLFASPWRCLTGHSHFISDLSLTSDNHFLLSASWDKTLRLWELTDKVSKTVEIFVGHTKEVLSCCFSAENRQILSSGADKTIKLWNVKGACRFTSTSGNHTDWVSNVRFLGRNVSKGNFANSFFASTGWDGRVKVWNTQSFEIKDSFKAHDGNINAIATSPKGNFIVTGGKDKQVFVWNFNDCTDPYSKFDAGASVTGLAFNPKNSTVAIGTENGVKLWDFEVKEKDEGSPLLCEVSYEMERPIKQNEEKVETVVKAKKFHQVTSLQWNCIGTVLYVGFSNGVIRVFETQVEAGSN